MEICKKKGRSGVSAAKKRSLWSEASRAGRYLSCLAMILNNNDQQQGNVIRMARWLWHQADPVRDRREWEAQTGFVCVCVYIFAGTSPKSRHLYSNCLSYCGRRTAHLIHSGLQRIICLLNTLLCPLHCSDHLLQIIFIILLCKHFTWKLQYIWYK